MGFDLDAFVQAAREIAQRDQPVREMNALMRETVVDPAAVAAGMPEIERDDETFHEDDSVTVSFARFQPGELVPPHNHKVAAFIGVYRGTEVNRFYRQVEGGIEFASQSAVAPGKTLSIGAEGIHAVHTGSDTPAEALHVYLGSLSTIERDLFDLDTGRSMPFTEEAYQRLLGPWPRG